MPKNGCLMLKKKEEKNFSIVSPIHGSKKINNVLDFSMIF